MRALSKSKLIAYRQCPKRFWLEVHQPGSRQDSAATQAVFKVGHEVGIVAQQIYDPVGEGVVIDLRAEGVQSAVARTGVLLKKRQPIFEAGFLAGGCVAFADVMLPLAGGVANGWKMVEVKSSSSVKHYQIEDAAIQSYVARSAGVDVRSVSIAHIDAAWVYPGGGDYKGMLVEQDVTDAAFVRHPEVASWIASAQQTRMQTMPPNILPKGQCVSPFPCGFQHRCRENGLEVNAASAWLPLAPPSKLSPALASQRGAQDVHEGRESLLSFIPLSEQSTILNGPPYSGVKGAKQDVLKHPLPAYFLDFEVVQFGVPRWAGTRPFQSFPFQFSVHRMDSCHRVRDGVQNPGQVRMA